MIGDWSLVLQERVTSRSKVYKEKEQRGRFGETDEKISREEYTLDWSQSKVFLVILNFAVYSVLHVVLVPVSFQAHMTLVNFRSLRHICERNTYKLHMFVFVLAYSCPHI